MFGTECLHRIERVEAILAGKEIVDGASAVGKAAKDCGAV
jgi:hypothetical protein